MNRPVAKSLSDLTADAWVCVAVQVYRDRWHFWDWSLSAADRDVLAAMRDSPIPAAVTMHEHLPNGTVQLIARLLPTALSARDRAKSRHVGAVMPLDGLPDPRRAEGAGAALREGVGR
jgi:hypothetical protein